jgi:cyclopropane fatty-acyl-phospholipid synthase-like methyltransferase
VGTRVTVSEADFIRLIVHGSTAFELLRTGLEFDLFEQLEAADGMVLAEVAAAIRVKPQPARVLLLGLTSLLLLERRGRRYVNTELARRKLLRSSPRYLGPLVDIQAHIINPTLGDFAESMRQNTNVGLRHLPGPGVTLYERLTVHPELQCVFYANMGDASRKAFELILDRYDFGRAQRVLDIGGGDGTNSIELARRYPQLTVTVLDHESVTRLAADGIDDLALRQRVLFRAGDMFVDPIPEGVDTVLYFHIFEIWSVERNVAFLRKCYAALPPGGACLIYSFVSDEDGCGPLSAGLVSPYFLTLASGEGMAYSASDIAQAATEAGFPIVKSYLDLGYHHALVVATK